MRSGCLTRTRSVISRLLMNVVITFSDRSQLSFACTRAVLWVLSVGTCPRVVVLSTCAAIAWQFLAPQLSAITLWVPASLLAIVALWIPAARLSIVTASKRKTSVGEKSTYYVLTWDSPSDWYWFHMKWYKWSLYSDLLFMDLSTKYAVWV